MLTLEKPKSYTLAKSKKRAFGKDIYLLGKEQYKRINEELIPRIFERVYEILSPNS